MVFYRKYNTATHIYVPIPKRGVADFAVGADWTPAAGDVKVSKDGGAAANIGTLPTAITMGNTAVWDFTVAAGEVQSAKTIITISDSATKAVEDQCLIIETYGNASAEIVADLSTTWPNAAAINAEVVDALATDNYAQPGQGAPAATTTLSTMIRYLYKWARNKKDNDGTNIKYYNDDESTVDHKQTVGESGGTVTKGEMVTGP